MSNLLLGTPIYSDDGVLYTPPLSAGSWTTTLPLSNVKDRNLWRVARSSTALNRDTRFRCDLGTDRTVRIAGIIQPPTARLSSAGKVRILGVPSTMLFDYEAGDDIADVGGTYSRTAGTSGTRVGSYTDSTGVVRVDYANENRALYSQDFTNAAWAKSANMLVTGDTTTDPLGGSTADTLKANGGNNQTVIQDLGTGVSAGYIFGLYIKRKTGSGNIQLTLDNGSTWTTVAVTASWAVYSITQTLANPRVGVRIATNLDEVYVWGARVNLGSTLDATYLATTSASASSPVRDGDFVSALRGVMIEAASTNICLQSENFGTTWSATGTPTRSAAAHTASGISLDLIGDDSGAAQEYYTQSPTFTGNGVKAISVYMKQGTSSAASGSQVTLVDNTAVANRLIATVTWVAGVPSVAASVGTYIGKETLADGVYRLLFASTSVTAANTNALNILPAGTLAEQGNVYAGGVQAEDATVPSSYIKTTTLTVARGADTLTMPTASSNGTIYQKYWDIATQAFVESTLAYTSGAAIPFTAGRVYLATRIATGTKTQAEMQAIVYDSGWMTAFPSGPTLEDLEGQNLPVLCFPSTTQTAARYWSCQIDDITNSNSYVDVSRFVVTGGYQPTVNASVGVQLGVETDSQRSVGDSGVAVYLERPKRRTVKWVLPEVTEAEALGTNLQLQRIVGTTRQLVVVIDPAATTYLLQQTMLATLRNQGPLEYAVSPRFTVPYEAVEEL